jgi:hypothetical protein
MEMEAMMRLFSTLMSQEKDSEPSDSDNEAADEAGDFDFGDINFDMLSKMGELFSHMNKPDMNAELLAALKPHLREENRHKIDTAAKISRMVSLFPLLKDSGILNDLF